MNTFLRAKTLAFLAAILSIFPLSAQADVSWSLYFYSESAGLNGDAGSFGTTATNGVYRLENVSITASGIGFGVHNSDWTITYGWSDEGRAVNDVGTACKLAVTGQANGWLNIHPGTYDVTWNVNNQTVRFDVHCPDGYKRISVLGDSYSTMSGWLTPSTNEAFFPHEDVQSADQTWWHQVISSGNYVLERLNAYSGSTMTYNTLYDWKNSSQKMDISTSFISRCTNLGNPDIILICGGTNDEWNNDNSMGDYKYSDWTDDDKYLFRPGFAYLLNLVKTTYPDAEVYFVLNDILDKVEESIVTICNHYNVPIAAPQGIAKDVSGHPTADGMETIANAVIAGLTNNDWYVDEGNEWYVSRASSGWILSQKFTQSATDNDVFTYDSFIPTAEDFDQYGGLSFCIATPEWAKYVCNSTITALDTEYDFVLSTTEGAWGNAYSTAMAVGNSYKLTWNKSMHQLKIEKNPITYNIVDGRAVATVDDYLRGGDISMLNYVESFGAKFYDANGTEKDALDIMKENGVNFARIRLYNNPGEEISYVGDDSNTYTYKLPAGYCDEDDVLNLAQRAKAHGMMIELTFHYSDFWTNGSMQFKPKDWKNMTLEQLKTAIYDYTKAFLQRMNAQGTSPEYVSLGNEIESGFLFGYYNAMDAVNAAWNQPANQAALLGEASKAVREACPESKIIIHYTLSSTIGWSRYNTLLTNLSNNGYTDYDIVGASYYPYWTNQKPTMLTSLADNVYSTFGKDLMVMETGYSWTQYRPSGRNGGDYEGQLHMNGTAYNEASEAGQKSFMQELQTVIKGNDHILGYLYWDPLMVDQQVNSSWIETTWAFKKSGGNWWQDGNVVSNTTLFDYEGKALPVFEAIAEDAVSVPDNVTISGISYTVEEGEPYTLTISDAGYATFYDVQSREIPNGLTVYTVQSYTGNQLDLTEYNGSNIPPATGVLLKGDAGTYNLWPRYDGNSSISGNMLYGTASEQTITSPTGSYYYYKLAKDNTNGLGWYWGAADGGVFTNGAHKAYLAVSQAIGTRGFIGLDDGTTAIEGIVKNAEITDGVYYNLQGQRVDNPKKGLYIVNGKKVVIK